MYLYKSREALKTRTKRALETRSKKTLKTLSKKALKTLSKKALKTLSKKLQNLGSAQLFPPQSCAAIIRSEFDMHCERRRTAVSLTLFIISAQFRIQTRRHKGRGWCSFKPTEHEGPEG